jgi:hypothetical protein
MQPSVFKAITWHIFLTKKPQLIIFANYELAVLRNIPWPSFEANNSNHCIVFIFMLLQPEGRKGATFTEIIFCLPDPKYSTTSAMTLTFVYCSTVYHIPSVFVSLYALPINKKLKRNIQALNFKRMLYVYIYIYVVPSTLSSCVMFFKYQWLSVRQLNFVISWIYFSLFLETATHTKTLLPETA